LKEKIEKQLAAYDEQLEAAQADAKAKKAKAEADQRSQGQDS
jgi:Skp family chaperone for outer membrane proteins